MDQVFDLFDNLGATDEQLDFQVVYASALNGWATLEEGETGENMEPLFQAIVDNVEPPQVDLEGPLQMQISQLDYSSYVGVIGVGRVTRGTVKPNQQVTVVSADGKNVTAKLVLFWVTWVCNVLKLNKRLRATSLRSPVLVN